MFSGSWRQRQGLIWAIFPLSSSSTRQNNHFRRRRRRKRHLNCNGAKPPSSFLFFFFFFHAKRKVKQSVMNRKWHQSHVGRVGILNKQKGEENKTRTTRQHKLLSLKKKPPFRSLLPLFLLLATQPNRSNQEMGGSRRRHHALGICGCKSSPG